MRENFCPACGRRHNFYEDHRHDGCSCDGHHQKKKFYDDDLRGLNLRLWQLVGRDIEVELENYETIHGEISHVGTDFVELLVKDHMRESQFDDKDGAEEELDSSNNGEEQEACPICKEHEQEKNRHTAIFSTDKINSVKFN